MTDLGDGLTEFTSGGQSFAADMVEWARWAAAQPGDLWQVIDAAREKLRQDHGVDLRPAAVERFLGALEDFVEGLKKKRGHTPG